MSTYKSNMKAVGLAMHKARTLALQAAAQQVVNEVVDRLRGGYTSGAYVTGTNTSSVVTHGPFRAQGEWRILVGTSIADPPYPVYWELGHLNIFMADWVRKPIWAPAFEDTIDRQVAAFTRVFRKNFAFGGGVTARVTMPTFSEAAD